MEEIIVNNQLAALLEAHGVETVQDAEFIRTNLPGKVQFINSRLDVMVFTGQQEKIIESFGDIGRSLEAALEANFRSFSMGSLHPLLAGLGYDDPRVTGDITIEQWEIDGLLWQAFIGNLVPKLIGPAPEQVSLPYDAFFDCFVAGIRASDPENPVHWFRGYYCQYEAEIIEKEFLRDNEYVEDAAALFGALPLVPDVTYYSCRNFVLLRKI